MRKKICQKCHTIKCIKNYNFYRIALKKLFCADSDFFAQENAFRNSAHWTSHIRIKKNIFIFKINWIFAKVLVGHCWKMGWCWKNCDFLVLLLWHLKISLFHRKKAKWVSLGGKFKIMRKKCKKIRGQVEVQLLANSIYQGFSPRKSRSMGW